MAGNPSEGLGDDFFEQILEVAPGYPSGAVLGSMPMVMGMMPVEQTGYFRHDNGTNRFRDTAVDVNNNNSNASSTSANSGLHERDTVHMQSLLPSYHGQLQSQQVRASSGPASQVQQPFHSQAMTGAVASASQPCAVRPRVRARRGQATDPHSIAERLRRERIAERMKALQEIVPSCNKTDRAAMLDEIVDYVKFLRLQVKVLSMSRLGGASAVAQLVADVPPSFGEGEDQPVWEKWSTDGTEEQVAKLMEEDIGAAMQFLQSKALCIMPISLASAIFRTHQPDAPSVVKPESDTPS